jgi:hypothetical protein
MAANQLPTLRACLVCRKAILEPDGWNLEGIMGEVELPESPCSLEAPLFEISVFIKLFSDCPVNPGRLSLVIRGPESKQHLGGGAAMVDQWGPTKKKHFAISLDVKVRPPVYKVLHFQVLWDGAFLGESTLGVKPPGEGSKVDHLGALEVTPLDAAQAAAEYRTEDGAAAA